MNFVFFPHFASEMEQFSGSQESILHLDMEEGVLNSSESRETDSPSHDNHRHQRHPLTGHPEATTATAVREPVDQHLVLNLQLHVEEIERNPSLVSVVSCLRLNIQI